MRPEFNRRGACPICERLFLSEDCPHTATDAKEEFYKQTDGKHIANLETTQAALVEALESVMGLTMIDDRLSTLDKGIGTATPDGQTLLNARAALKLARGET